MGFLNNLFGGKRTKISQSMSPELATRIIQEYGAVMQNNAPPPDGVGDISNLPYPKDQIKQALIIGLKSNDDPQIQEMLKIGYIQLASWQKGVGETKPGLDLSNLDLNANPEELTEAILAQDIGNDKWSQAVLSEQAALQEELNNLGF